MPKLLKRAQQADLDKVKETLDQLMGLLKSHPQVKALFARYKVPIEELDSIPIDFKELDVSAKTKDEKIWLNKNLLEDGDILADAHYLIHELVHVLQQKTGVADKHDPKKYPDYLSIPTEIEAFREQIQFIAEYKGNEEAQKYLNDLLDFHELDGEARARKEKELSPPKFVKIHVQNSKGKKLEHHYIDAKEWGAPAGKIENGEAPIEAAARELKERTGYQTDPNSLTFTGSANDFYEFEVDFEDLNRVGKPQTEIRLANLQGPFDAFETPVLKESTHTSVHVARTEGESNADGETGWADFADPVQALAFAISRMGPGFNVSVGTPPEKLWGLVIQRKFSSNDGENFVESIDRSIEWSKAVDYLGTLESLIAQAGGYK